MGISILQQLGYSDEEWRKHRLSEMSKPLVSRKKELAEDIFLFLERSARLESINLSEILQGIAEQKQVGGEYQVRLESLIKLNKSEVFYALKQLKIDIPLQLLRGKKKTEKKITQKISNSASIEKEGLDMGDSADVEDQVAVPLGYEAWNLNEIENYENKTVSYWTTQGKYGKGKFFIHPKRLHEYCFQTVDGRLVVFTEAHKKRLTVEGTEFRFKALDQSLGS